MVYKNFTYFFIVYLYVFIYFQIKLKQQLAAIDSDHTIDTVEKAKRKQNLILVNSVNCAVSTSSYASVTGMSSSNMSPLAPAFYPPGDTVGSVIGMCIQIYRQ